MDGKSDLSGVYFEESNLDGGIKGIYLVGNLVYLTSRILCFCMLDTTEIE